MVAVLVGLLVSTVGLDPISGVSRFTFGASQLYDGFHVIPALIGPFALSVVFTELEKGKLWSRLIERVSKGFPTWPRPGRAG